MVMAPHAKGSFLPLIFFATFAYMFMCEVHSERIDLHTAPDLIEDLFSFDRIVGDTLMKCPFPLSHGKSYIESHMWLRSDALKYGGDIGTPFLTENPLHVYALVKRLVLAYPDIKALFDSLKETEDDDCSDDNPDCEIWSHEDTCRTNVLFMMKTCPKTCDFCNFLKGVREVKAAEKEVQLPNALDLQGASDGLAALQKVYHLSIDKLKKGDIHDKETSVVLSPWDCMEIGEAFLREKTYSTAWFWYRNLLNSTNINENPVLMNLIIKKMKFAAKEHDNDWQNDDKHFGKLIKEDPFQRLRPTKYTVYCNEYVDKSQIEEGRTCQLTTRGNPYFVLQPVKQETLKTNPEISMFHDIISEVEMEAIKAMSRGQFQKDIKPQRRSEVTWLRNKSDPIISNIERRASMLAGLSFTDGSDDFVDLEPLKIRNYGLGGHLGPHIDVQFKHESDAETADGFPDGDRLGTIIYYLNEVIHGGRLVFPNVGVSFLPTKGSAVFFYNLKRNGRIDLDVMHGSCPILIGSKWVALKWFREQYNFLARPCSLNQEE